MSSKKLVKEPQDLLKEPASKLTLSKKIPNLYISFELYEKKFQEKEYHDLQVSDLKCMKEIVSALLKSKSIDDLGTMWRGQTNPRKSHKLSNHDFAKDIIHLGKNGKPFRLHGIFRGQCFYLICIDPNHDVNT